MRIAVALSFVCFVFDFVFCLFRLLKYRHDKESKKFHFAYDSLWLDLTAILALIVGSHFGATYL